MIFDSTSAYYNNELDYFQDLSFLKLETQIVVLQDDKIWYPMGWKAISSEITVLYACWIKKKRTT